jgi:hypothetical protein
MAVGTLWASRGLVFLCCHVQSVNAKIVEVIPSRAAAVLLPLTIVLRNGPVNKPVMLLVHGSVVQPLVHSVQ